MADPKEFKNSTLAERAKARRGVKKVDAAEVEDKAVKAADEKKAPAKGAARKS